MRRFTAYRACILLLLAAALGSCDREPVAPTPASPAAALAPLEAAFLPLIRTFARVVSLPGEVVAAEVSSPAARATRAATIPLKARQERALGAELGRYRLTYYWIAREQPSPRPRGVPLLDKQCRPLARVSADFARRVALEGTGRLRDGRVINVAGNCDCGGRACYVALDEDARWGLGATHKPLHPFRSVAVDTAQIELGMSLYIPELDGLTMPGHAPWGGFVHDGCVVASDKGGNVEGQHIDLFLGRRSHYHAFSKRHRLRSVTVFEGRGRCDVPHRSVASGRSAT